MKLYLAGPMRGLPEFNFPAFREARERLRAQGHTVWCPAENDASTDGFDGSGQPATLDYRHYMRRDLPAVLDADAVAVLPGWENSKGARIEVHVARECGIPVVYAATLLPVRSASPAPPEGGTTPLHETIKRLRAEVVEAFDRATNQPSYQESVYAHDAGYGGAPVRATGEGTDTEAALQEAFCDGVAYAANTMSDSLDDAKQEARSRYTARSTPPSPPVTE